MTWVLSGKLHCASVCAARKMLFVRAFHVDTFSGASLLRVEDRRPEDSQILLLAFLQ